LPSCGSCCARCTGSCWSSGMVCVYAPELNADEGVWNLLKRVELKNRCCQDLEELRWEVQCAIRRLQRTPHRIAACFRQAGLVQ
jgi:hypothetical protein